MADWPVAPGLLRQPDQRSCGAAAVVAARALADPLWARSLDGAEAVRREILATHRRLTSAVTPAGGLRMPWPRALGTPPWSVAAALADVHGVGYRTRLVRGSGAAAHDLLAAAGRPAALYVGSRWLPRHVVLVADGQVFEPSRGVLVTRDRAAYSTGRLELAGWDWPWLVVVPR